MNTDNQSLQSALRAIAAESAQAAAPDRVREELRAALQARARRRRAAAWWPALLGAAAALVVGIWLGGSRSAVQPETETAAVPPAVTLPSAPAADESAVPRPAPAPRARLARASASRPESAAASPWFFYSPAPVTQRGHVIPVTVSASTAAQFGIYRASDSVSAQLFIGDDGLVRAIRFVQ